MMVGLLILLTGLLNFFHFLMGIFLNKLTVNTEYAKLWAVETSNFFYQLFVQSVIIAFIAFLFTFCLIEIISPYLNFNLFNYVLIIEKNLLFIQTSRVYGIHLIFMYDIMLYNCIAHTLHTHPDRDSWQ